MEQGHRSGHPERPKPGPLRRRIQKPITIKDAGGNNVNTFTTPVWIAGNKVDPELQQDPAGRKRRPLLVQRSRGSGEQTRFAQDHRRSLPTPGRTLSTMVMSRERAGISHRPSTMPHTHGNYRFDKGSSALDQRHRAVINWVWQPTFTKSTSAIARYVVNGWGIIRDRTIASAQPVTPTQSS